MKAPFEQGDVGVASGPSAEEQSALKTSVSDAVLKALAEFKEIPRGQLSIRVGKLLQGSANASAALALLLRDEFLASIPGTVYDKKTIKLAA